MRFDARIPPLEREELKSLIGQQLVEVAINGWSVYIATDVCDLCVIPEEIDTPDNDHLYADVTRPKVSEPVDSRWKLIGAKLGKITSANILTTVVTFSPPQLGKAIEIGDATIPEGIQYGPIFSHPSQQDASNPINSIVDLDIGFEICTETNDKITVYTDGCLFFVFAVLNQEVISEEVTERTSLLTV